MKTVLAFGTFDMLHPGHISYLTQARGLGDRLVVVIATDANVLKIKGKKPVHGQDERKAVVEALRMVDEAFVGSEDDMIRSVERAKPDVVAMGYDQQPGTEEIERKLAAKKIRARVVRLEPYRPEVFKSTKIRERIAGAGGTER